VSSINSLPALENRRRRNLRQPCQRSGEGPVQGKATRLSGYAAVYNSDREDPGGFTEQIAPGAFDAVLASGQDVRCLVNYDPFPAFVRNTEWNADTDFGILKWPTSAV
jgi:phage head maturation protease